MSFSDWITIVSILLAVLLAVFKFDELELLNLKRYRLYAFLPMFLLFVSGIAAYYNSNEHPHYLSIFWSSSGLSSGLWAIIWMLLSIVCTIFMWNRFTNKKPSEKVIDKYKDYLGTIEASKFLTLFRKYERHFFSTKIDNNWHIYTPLISQQDWWDIAPIDTYRNDEKFHNVDVSVARSFLESQLSNIPKSQLAKEIVQQADTNKLDTHTPVLNIFLKNAECIKRYRDRNIFLRTIQIISTEYFSSINFIERDRNIFLLEPSSSTRKGIFQYELPPFYYVELINCYWYQVFKSNAKVSGLHFYVRWSNDLLSVAPDLKEKNSDVDVPNLYVEAVDQMLWNIRGWVRYIEDYSLVDFHWAAKHFSELELWILKDINDLYLNKISESWFISKVKSFFSNLILCKNYNTKTYSPDLSSLNDIRKDYKEKAFQNLKREDFFSVEEQENSGYKWLKGELDH